MIWYDGVVGWIYVAMWCDVLWWHDVMWNICVGKQTWSFMRIDHKAIKWQTWYPESVLYIKKRNRTQHSSVLVRTLFIFDSLHTAVFFIEDNNHFPLWSSPSLTLYVLDKGSAAKTHRRDESVRVEYRRESGIVWFSSICCNEVVVMLFEEVRRVLCRWVARYRFIWWSTLWYNIPSRVKIM